MTIRQHRGDLPDLARYKVGAVAIDTETMGLDVRRDRLCVVQLSPGDGTADVVQIAPGAAGGTNIKALLADASVLKLFHFGRFDIATLYHAFGVMAGPVYCTKIASRLARTYTDKHGLKDLTRELIGVDLSKQQQLVRLGRRRPDRGPGDLRGVRRAVSARPAGKARRHAGPRGPDRARRRLLPVPPRPGPAGPGGLGRTRIFFPIVKAVAGRRGRATFLGQLYPGSR